VDGRCRPLDNAEMDLGILWGELALSVLPVYKKIDWSSEDDIRDYATTIMKRLDRKKDNNTAATLASSRRAQWRKPKAKANYDSFDNDYLDDDSEGGTLRKWTRRE